MAYLFETDLLKTEKKELVARSWKHTYTNAAVFWRQQVFSNLKQAGQ